MTTSAPFISKDDINALKAYVAGPSSLNQAESTVLVHCTHSNLQARFFEIRLDTHVSRAEILNAPSLRCNRMHAECAAGPSPCPSWG